MPENDFEKQVQQLFNELKLKPSVEVWPKVSNRIRKEKSRRKAFVWFPLALLLLGAGGYWLLQNNGSILPAHRITETTPAPGNDNPDISSNTKDNPSVSVKPGDISKTGKQKINTEMPSSAHNADPDGKLNNDGSGSDSHALNGQRNSEKPPVNSQALDKKKQPAQPVVQLPVPDNAGNIDATARKEIKPAQSMAERDQKDMAHTRKSGTFNPENKSLALTPLIAVPQSVWISPFLLPGVETGKTLDSNSKKHFPDNILNSTNTPVKLTKKKTWEWGIAGGAGVSSVSHGLSDFFGNSRTEKSALNAIPNTPNMSNNIGFLTGQNSLVAALPPPASTVKTGLAWQAGGFVKWKTTSRLAVTAGLQYSYYSTNRAVGNDINNYRLALGNTHNDANASYAGYYIGGQNINYTNRYHVIEIPAGVQWQLNKGVKFPLLLNGGLSLSYLANTTAVHYHTQTGSYYEDKALFNKVQIGIHAGLSVKVFGKTQRPVYLGPVIQYNLTNLLKPSENLSQNLMYTGLKAEWVLWRK